MPQHSPISFRAPKSFSDAAAADPPPPPAVLDFPQFGQRIKKPERLSQPRAAAVVGQQRPHSVNTGDLGGHLGRSSNLRKRNFHAAAAAAADKGGDLANNRHQRPLLKKKKKKILEEDEQDDQVAQPARAFIRYVFKLPVQKS